MKVLTWHGVHDVRVPPGHLQRAEAGTEYLQFSPAKQLAEVEQQVMKNMQAMGGPQ